MVGITLLGESNNAKKRDCENYTLRREKNLDVISLLLQNPNIDPRIVKFNCAILKSIDENIILKQNNNAIFNYNIIVNEWFNCAARTITEIFDIDSINDKFNVYLSDDLIYCSVSNNIGKTIVKIGNKYVERIVSNIANISSVHFNKHPINANKNIIGHNQDINIWKARRSLAHLSYLLLHETVHIIQNTMENETDILMNDVINNRTLCAVIMEEAMASFISTFLNKISKENLIYYISEYLPLKNYIGNDIKKMRYIGYIIGIMAGRYAIAQNNDDYIISEINLLFNMLPKSEFDVILENLIKMTKYNKSDLIKGKEFFEIIWYVNRLRRDAAHNIEMN